MCLPDKNKALRRQAQIEKQNREIEDLNGKLIILARLYKGHA